MLLDLVSRCFIGYLVLLLFFGCGEKEEEIQNPVTIIDLYQRDDLIIFEKFVVIYEDDDYLVKSPLSKFINEIENYFISDYEGYLATINLILEDAAIRDSLNVNDYIEGYRIRFLFSRYASKWVLLYAR